MTAKYEAAPVLYTEEIEKFCDGLEREKQIDDPRILALSCFNVSLRRFEEAYGGQFRKAIQRFDNFIFHCRFLRSKI